MLGRGIRVHRLVAAAGALALVLGATVGGTSPAGAATTYDRQLATWGDADTIVQRLTEHRSAGADHIIVAALDEGDQPGPFDVARQLADRLIAIDDPAR
jgi:hypothetical protein